MQVEMSDSAAIHRLSEEMAELRRLVCKLLAEKEADRCILRSMRLILSALDPEFRRLSDAHVRGLREHFAAIGLDENDPIVKATLAEAESFLAEDKRPLREMMSVIEGGRGIADEEKR